MYSLTEYQGQSSLDKHGGIALNTSYETCKKPVWLVLLKLAVLLGMMAVGTALVTPPLMQWLPAWKAAPVTIGILLIYIGVAFFFRPQYNGDNMGWCGGFANDPFQYSDNINRFLFKLHMLLGPGRFAAETMLDACALVGLARGPEVVEGAAEPALVIDSALDSPAAGGADAALPPPRADRFDKPRSEAALGYSPGAAHNPVSH